MKDRIDISYFALGNRNFKCLNEHPNLYKSTSSVKSTASNLMERNYLDFEPGVLNNQARYSSTTNSKEYSKGSEIYYKYHPEYKYYHNTNEQNKPLNNYLNPVNQYIYRENPMIKSAEQLLCIQRQKKQIDFNDAVEPFKIAKNSQDLQDPQNFNQKLQTEPSKNKNIDKYKDQDQDIIALKNPMNKNILVSNDYHLETSTKTQRRIKPPSRIPNIEELKYGSYLESKLSPEYLRNYDKESLKNIENYYINKKENLHVLSRFGNWITLRPDDKNRSHALEKLSHGTYETSIVAPVWMDIASRRRNRKTIDVDNSNSMKNYDYMELNNKMFKRQEYNTSIRDKGKLTILQDKDQKNAKPVYLKDSFEKNRIIMEQEDKDFKYNIQNNDLQNNNNNNK